jgi:radical SAM protein with 4Fe4S-binding SPASM domain
MKKAWRALCSGPLIRDIELRIDITNSCNLRCIMCHQPYRDMDVRVMSFETFKRITEDILARVNILFLSWTTEPLLNKELPQIIQYAKKKGVPCITLATNLTLLTDNLAAAFVGNGLDRINISIDAADQKLYALIRQRDCLSLVLENIKKIQEFKIKFHCRFPHIALNMVLLKMNLSQIIPMIDCAESFGIRELNCSDISIPSRYNDQKIDQQLIGLSSSFNLFDQKIETADLAIQTLFRRAAKHAKEKKVLLTLPGMFSQYGLSRFPKNLARGLYSLQKSACFPTRSMMHLALAYIKIRLIKKGAFCSFPWRQIVVTAEGEVMPCCVWDNKNAIGNINPERLIDIWNGAMFNRLRKELASGTVQGQCRTCNRARSFVRQGI